MIPMSKIIRSRFVIISSGVAISLAAVSGVALASIGSQGKLAGNSPTSSVVDHIKVPPGDRKPAVVPHITYPGMGVNVSALAPTTSPVRLAATAGSSVNARSSFDRQLVPQMVLGKTLSTQTPLVQLRSVTELYPKSPDVSVGKPYTAWVITYSNTTEVGLGPVPVKDSGCQFVGIMDASTGAWTEFFQSCDKPLP